MREKLHVYIVLEFAAGVTTVVGAYALREYAQRKVEKLKKPRDEYPEVPRTFGIIRKAVNGIEMRESVA